MSKRSLAVLAALLGATLQAQAATAWNEAVDGDLSDSGLTATFVAMSSGSNEVIGTTGGGPAIDRDYFTFTVPAGSMLSAVIVDPGTTVSGGSSFFAMQAGPQVTTTPNGGGIEALLGFIHYGPEAVGTNLLASILPGPSFVLPSGSYAVWVQELSGVVPYHFDFVISAVPEPATALLLGAGLLALQRRSARSAATPQNTAKPSQ